MLTTARFLFLALRAALLLALDAISPPACAACDAQVSRRAVFCAACARTVVRIEGDGVLPPEPGSACPELTAPVDANPRSQGARARPSEGRGVRASSTSSLARGQLAPTVARVIAFAVFGGAIAITLRRLKFAARPDLARPLGHLARRAVRDADLRADLVIPVPLHARRLAERGYNQAALIARCVAEELCLPLATRVLARVRSTPQQALLDRADRVRNVHRAFSVRRAAAIQGKRVLLVDDVATTGATLTACAVALREAGAESVTAVVVAQASLEEREDGDGHSPTR